MKIDLSAKTQRWRLAAFLLCLLAVIIMMIPGSFIWCDSEKIYGTGSYLWNNPILGYTMIWFGLAAVSALISMTAFLRKRNVTFLFFVFHLPCLWFTCRWSGLFAISAAVDGHFAPLPFLPPLLLIIATATVVILWRSGKKEAP